ncbi:MAG: DUF485 domain-containing protein [Gammaproteobacteria bacterium]|nr:MAG: DUF485 domain-containing protein [Gammaproteobacteria bacterium]
MGGHGPAVKLGKDNATGYKSALGVKLFFVYLVVYIGFVAINVFKPELMEEVIGGQSVSIIYGFGLIILALIMALVYNAMCGKAEARLNKDLDK